MAGSHTFIIQYVAFLFFLAFIFSLGAPAFLENLPEPPEIPEPPEKAKEMAWWEKIASWLMHKVDYLIYVFKYIAYFFTLMGVTAKPEYGYVGMVVLVPMIVGLIWVVLKLIRGGG